MASTQGSTLQRERGPGCRHRSRQQTPISTLLDVGTKHRKSASCARCVAVRARVDGWTSCVPAESHGQADLILAGLR